MAVALTFLQAAADAANASTYTYSSQNFGTAASDRYIIAAISGRKSGAGTTLSSVTIGGVSAAIVKQATATNTNTNVVALAVAAVPTGTSGTVELVFADPMLRSGLALYAVTGADMSAAHDTDEDNSASDPSMSIDVPAGGFAIAVAGVGANATDSWSGLTENYGTGIESNTLRFTGASDTFGSAQSGLAVVCDFSIGAGNEPVGVVASWAEASSGAQTLTVADSADGDTFGDLTVAPGAVTLAVGDSADGDTFGDLTVAPGAVTLAVGDFADADAFGDLTVAIGPVTLSLAAFADGDTFGDLTVAPGAVTLTVADFAEGDTFGDLVLAESGVLAVAAFADGDTFGDLTVAPGAVTLAVAAFADGDAFGALSLAEDGALAVAAFADGDTFGTLAVAPGAVTLGVAAFADGDAFGTIVAAPGAVTLNLAAFGIASGFGTIVVTGPLILGGFVNDNGFGAMAVTGQEVAAIHQTGRRRVIVRAPEGVIVRPSNAVSWS